MTHIFFRQPHKNHKSSCLSFFIISAFVFSLLISLPSSVLASFSIETVDGGGINVGEYSSIAIDKDGNLHVAYRDATNLDLRYIKRAGSVWGGPQTVDSAGDVGHYTSIAIDGSGNPHISYWDVTNNDLKYAKWNGASWNLQTVDFTGEVGAMSSIVIDSSGNPHISYRYSTNADLKYAKWNGASWNLQTVDSAGNVGRFTSMALDGSGNPHISYRDQINNDLKYAKWNGASWSVETVDFAGDVGNYTSIVIDGSGNPHISYWDVTNNDLKIAKWNGVFWSIETVDSGGAVGLHASLALDGSGNPHISYYDNTNLDLKYAKWNGASWNLQTVDSAGRVGEYTSLVLDGSGNAHISYQDFTNADLKVAHWTMDDLPPVSQVTLPLDNSFYTSLVTISGTAYDAHSPLAKVEVSIKDETTLKFWNGSAWAEAESWVKADGLENWSFVPPAESGHSYFAKSRAFDASGNMESLYNLNGDTWATLAPMPTPRHEPASGVIDGNLYVVGGTGSSGDSAAFEVYDPLTNAWATKAPMPTARHVLAAGVINGKLYAVGGYKGGPLAVLEVYDPATDTWTKKAPMPTARWDLAPGAVGGNLYAVGGHNGGLLSLLEAYDPMADGWVAKSPMPTARYGQVAGVINGRLYIVGGYKSGPLPTLEVYTPSEASGGVRYTYKIPSATADGATTVVSTQTASATETVISTQSATLPLAPSDLTTTPSTGAIALSWAVSASTDITAYHVYMATSASNLFSQPAAVLSSTATSWEAGGLTAGLLYYFSVRAKNGFGEEKNTNIVSAAPLANSHNFCSVGIKVPHNGKKVSGESLTVIAEILCGDPSQIGSVRFEYKLASQTNWLAVPASNSNHPNPDTTSPYFVHWNVGALASGEYHVRAVAKSKEKEDPAPGYITIFADHSDPDVLENGTTKTEKIGNHKDNKVRAGFSNQVADVEIPAGSLSSAETKLSLNLNPSSLPSAAGLLSAKAVVSIELENGQHTLNKEASLTIPYEDEDGDGIVDGLGIGEDSLSAYYYDEGKKSWKKLSSSVDAAKNIVTLKTNHFSLFGLFTPAPEIPFALGEAYIFPNPSRGSQNPIFHIEVGQADEVEVFIYDVSGALVETLRTTGSPQTINSTLAYEIPWTPTASGVYVAVIQARKSGEADIRLSRKFGVIK